MRRICSSKHIKQSGHAARANYEQKHNQYLPAFRDVPRRRVGAAVSGIPPLGERRHLPDLQSYRTPMNFKNLGSYVYSSQRKAEDADALATAIEEYCSEVWQGGLTPDGDKLAACDFDFIAKDEWEDAHYIPKPTPFELENTLYECGICDWLHPWAFDGDCRDDANRYGDAEDYATKKQVNIYAVTVRSWEERQAADNA